jgi:hypothetical protein
MLRRFIRLNRFLGVFLGFSFSLKRRGLGFLLRLQSCHRGGGFGLRLNMLRVSRTVGLRDFRRFWFSFTFPRIIPPWLIPAGPNYRIS